MTTHQDTIMRKRPKRERPRYVVGYDGDEEDLIWGESDWDCCAVERTRELAEDALRRMILRESNRVIYKLVPVAVLRPGSDKVEWRKRRRK